MCWVMAGRGRARRPERVSETICREERYRREEVDSRLFFFFLFFFIFLFFYFFILFFYFLNV